MNAPKNDQQKFLSSIGLAIKPKDISFGNKYLWDSNLKDQRKWYIPVIWDRPVPEYSPTRGRIYKLYGKWASFL